MIERDWRSGWPRPRRRARRPAGGRRRDEVERVDVDPGAGRQAGRVEAVLEVEPIDAAGGPDAPLLAGVRDLEAGDRLAGVVGEDARRRRDQACRSAGRRMRARRSPRRRSCRCRRRCRCRCRPCKSCWRSCRLSANSHPAGSTFGRAGRRERVEVLRVGRVERQSGDRASRLRAEDLKQTGRGEKRCRCDRGGSPYHHVARPCGREEIEAAILAARR